MKILFIWHSAADPNNRRLFESLIRRPGLDVRVLTLRQVDDRLTLWRMVRPVARVDRQTGSRFAVIPGRALLPQSLGHHFHLGLPGLLAGFRPDVIHLVAEAATFIAVETAILRPLLSPRSRLVLHVIQNITVDYRWPWPVLERFVLRQIDAAVAYSHGAAKVLKRHGFSKPLFIRPFGADPGPLAKARGLRLRRKLGGRLPVVGWVGRMFSGKGLHVLLAASARMRRPHQLLVVGDGPRRAMEMALAAQLGIADRIHWAGPVPADRMPEYYAAMDVYTHPAISRPPDMPAWKEQFARTLVEAMLAGVPIVSTRSGEIPWVVGNGGLIVPEKNPKALAAALDRVLASRRLRTDLGRRGRARAMANFTWDRAAEELIGIWRKLAG
jgi:glycosyltransferase involved in cell wall biosynthesis